LALPPLDSQDHLVDIGAGTGKLALLIAKGYPRLGHVTLIEPNQDKIERAQERLAQALPQAQINQLAQAMGLGDVNLQNVATVATIGSVLMPTLELSSGNLGEGLAWLRAVLAEIKALLQPGAYVYALETLALPWAHGNEDDPVRRLTMAELTAEFTRAGFIQPECMYRFRDRVIIRAQKPNS
jgi:SAM-dependent methyltransferase